MTLNCFFICIEICHTVSFTFPHDSGFFLTVLTTTTIFLYTGIGPKGVSGVDTKCSFPVAFALFGLTLVVATPVLFLALLYAARLLFKASNFVPISSLILFMFLA